MTSRTMRVVLLLVMSVSTLENGYLDDEDLPIIEIFDLSYPTTWKDMMEFYGAVKNGWRICVNCGIPGLGTGFHLEHAVIPGAMQPSMIPTDYLLTRLVVIDLTSITKKIPELVLSLEAALQWIVLRHDPREPTLLLFKFGWKSKSKRRQCNCQIPGISYDLAEYIATNLSRVVGVATDAPSLESRETRELKTRTVSNMLGRNGLYIIQNVNINKKIPERGCMSLAMPLKMLDAAYVPTRLTAFCPTQKTERFVTIALKKQEEIIELVKADTDVGLAEIMY